MFLEAPGGRWNAVTARRLSGHQVGDGDFNLGDATSKLP